MRSSPPSAVKFRPGFWRSASAIALICGTFLGLAVSPVAAVPADVRPHALSPGPAPAGASDLGAAPSSQVVRVSVALAPSHRSQLDQLLADQRNPASPRYHHWLAPGQFAKRFAPSAAQVSAVTQWLRTQGLRPAASGFLVSASAPAPVMASALGTSFDRYAYRGQVGYLARSAPLVPAALANGQINSVLGLDTVGTLHPELAPPASIAPRSNVAHTSVPHANLPHALSSQVAVPTACPTAQSVAQFDSYYTLDTEGAAYGLGALIGAGQSGAGTTIGLFELGQASASDVSTYKSCFGLTNPFSVSNVDGGAPAGSRGTTEADLDVEQVMTQAPGASVVSYQGPNSAQGAYDTWSAIIGSDVAQVVSTSWGQCEPFAAANGSIPAFSTLFTQAAAQGQSIFAASGDNGAQDCLPGGATASQYKAEVDYPGSDPYVTTVGGTALFAPQNEVVWNACQGTENRTCAASGGAAGGGLSRYESRVSYQQNLYSWTTPQLCATECRETPDVSANAGVGMIVYVNGTWLGVGGTSVAAPLLAGVFSDVQNGCLSPPGDVAAPLYSLYGQSSYGSAFTDVTVGDNDLTGDNAGAFAAATGYDAASGIGSPVAAGLSCAEVSSVGSGQAGDHVTVSGLGLEHSTISFGANAAAVVSASATSATVVVPAGSGTVTVHATNDFGAGNVTSSFTYGATTTTTTASPAPSSQPPPAHGYWLVGSDGGIFTFGSAQFYGSTGSLQLQRPVVGITPTSDRAGYWLVASDGGLFSFGDSSYDGSIPGLGLHPAGSGLPHSLNAPIVGMVPALDGAGYFMVASDGGVFAFGSAQFEGSCPGIGGCVGKAVAVMPDASAHGYWVVTDQGHVYAFGDAANFGQPIGAQNYPVTSAVRTPDGNGYWILFSNGSVANFGDAADYGSPVGSVGGLNYGSAIFATADGGGYWVASTTGQVFNYGDAPNDGSMAGTHLNGSVIAATGW